MDNQNYFDKIFTSCLANDNSQDKAAQIVIDAYLDNKPSGSKKKKVSPEARHQLFWHSEFSPYLLGLLIDDVEDRNIKSDAKKVQKVDNSIAVQKRVIEFGVDKWKALAQKALTDGRLSEKEMEILSKTVLVKNKIPTPRQSEALSKVMDRYELA